MYAQQSDGPKLNDAQIEQLLENGKHQYGWRCLDGDARALCVVGLRFTVVPDPGQEKDKAGFARKMQLFAGMLSRSGYPVVTLAIEQRAGGRPWATFRVRTPQYKLPFPGADVERACEVELLRD